MQRVVILGAAGAGKSELANRLSRATGLPVVYLDRIFWGPGWQPAPAAAAQDELRRAIAGEHWIIDGNFLGDDARFDRADTVVFLDLARRVCIARILWRALRDRRRTRPDLPDGSRESFDPGLLRWVWSYRRTDRPRVLALLASLGPNVTVLHARSRRDVDAIVPSDA